jgi:sulfane dehydrogenase subunit SoxC
MVDRPLSFSMDDLKRLPSVSRVHFVECHGNSSPQIHNPENSKNPNMGLPVQYLHGMASCSEWSGVPFSVLLNEAGIKKEGTWLVLEGGDQGKFSHTLPTAKALEDCFVAYGQNGEPLRREQVTDPGVGPRLGRTPQRQVSETWVVDEPTTPGIT